MILVIAEQREGVLSRATWEAVAAAQQLSSKASQGAELHIALIGSNAPSGDLAAAGVGEVLVIEDESLMRYTPDGYVVALSSVIRSMSPEFVVLAHTYQARDFVPALAARLNASLVTDVTAVAGASGDVRFVRPMFQGKLAAEVKAGSGTPCIVSVQLGAFRGDAIRKGTVPSAVSRPQVDLGQLQIRQEPEPPFQEARQAVDLSQAERIVAVGRGIKSKEQLPVAEALARALGAELAASRPICDSGWLPMERQIGSSGQTVAPKLYVALGISGAIQHLVGMKGSRTIVAINKDPDAPIFEVADYGITGDLFEIVPAIVKELEKGL